ncbi:hypothetical protein ACTWPT_27015 [Nonomuraea sp. 3N208]|uniref:hypothetical protein n=1 Tax=Nonomuraea sp. 3N208 TaxID=3457421 RepID=UPI003FD5B0E1
MKVAEQVVTQLLTADGADGTNEATGHIPVLDAVAAVGFMMIPYRQQACGPDELPADYQLLLRTVSATGGPIICKNICRAAGLGTASGQVEGTRAKLNRLAERGWLRKMPNGSFAASP